jgi:hypothetical protein
LIECKDARVQGDVGSGARFVRSVYSREANDFTGSRASIDSLWVARLRDRNGAIDEDLHKQELRVVVQSTNAQSVDGVGLIRLTIAA